MRAARGCIALGAINIPQLLTQCEPTMMLSNTAEHTSRRSSTIVAAVCLLAVVQSVCATPGGSVAAVGAEAALGRSKRGLPFLPGSGNGYIIAIALPIGSGPRHVFTAFNFELHFGLADNSTFSPTGLITRWQGKRSVDSAPPADNSNADIETPPPPQKPTPPLKSKKNMLTRKHVYRVIENQLSRAGYNGTACLLKTICNTAETDLVENNGVFGNLFHIVFTPTSSRDEGLPEFFYEAEARGAGGHCEPYDGTCPRSLLEQVSTMFEMFE